jgi:hypothetical protein
LLKLIHAYVAVLVGKGRTKNYTPSVIFKKMLKENNRPKRRKFAQSGHPAPIGPEGLQDGNKKDILNFTPAPRGELHPLGGKFVP